MDIKRRGLEVFESQGPLAWCLGIALIVAAFFCSIAFLVHIASEIPSQMQVCTQRSGTWSHTLSQPEGHDTIAHYSDKCQMP
jgi:hypothetical protein